LAFAVRAREREEKHRRVSTEELIEQITTFFLVGYETASGVMHFTLWALARDLERQQKLREEILQFGREPTFDEIWNDEALPYLDAVVKEGYASHTHTSPPFFQLFFSHF
jgi:cytochrome P450